MACEVDSMANALRAVVHQGRIELEEPVELPDGTHVRVTVHPDHPTKSETGTVAEARRDLYRLLEEAEEDLRNGDQGVSVEAMRERLQA